VIQRRAVLRALKLFMKWIARLKRAMTAGGKICQLGNPPQYLGKTK